MRLMAPLSGQTPQLGSTWQEDESAEERRRTRSPEVWMTDVRSHSASPPPSSVRLGPRENLRLFGVPGYGVRVTMAGNFTILRRGRGGHSSELGWTCAALLSLCFCLTLACPCLAELGSHGRKSGREKRGEGRKSGSRGICTTIHRRSI